MKSLLSAAIAAFALTAVSAVAAPMIKPYLAAALADPDRAAEAGADARRKPGEILAFAGLAPGDKVVDLIPGGGYFTKIFSKVVGPEGHVFVVWPNEYAAESHPDPENSAKLAATPATP